MVWSTFLSPTSLSATWNLSTYRSYASTSTNISGQRHLIFADRNFIPLLLVWCVLGIRWRFSHHPHFITNCVAVLSQWTNHLRTYNPIKRIWGACQVQWNTSLLRFASIYGLQYKGMKRDSFVAECEAQKLKCECWFIAQWDWWDGNGELVKLVKHYIDVIMTTVASQITSLKVVYSTVYSDADQRKRQTPRHWPLCGEFTGTGEFPTQRASNAENGSIRWRHLEATKV